MPTRWEITKAVRASKLPAPARLVMLVLADVAEVGTAEIPHQFTPSLTVLTNETGLSRSTVAEHLNSLEEKGWIDRSRPSTKAALGEFERTRYQLLIPADLVRGTDQEVVRETDYLVQVTDHLVREADQPSAAHGLDLVRQADPDTDHYQISSDHKNSLSSEIAVRRSTTVDRADVEKVCRYLVDKIVANGSRKPRITPAWRHSARLLLDKDGKTVEQVIKAIDWCQSDEFWRANVLSMPKLREKYDQLRLAAQRPANGRASPKRSTTDDRVSAALALAERFDRGEIGT